MRYWTLIWAGLRRKPLRSMLTAMSTVAAFVLFAILHGVTAQFGRLMEQLGDSRLRVTGRSGVAVGLPLAYVSRVERFPGVGAVTYYSYLGGSIRDSKQPIAAGAIDLRGFLKVFPELILPASQADKMLHTRTAAVVGYELARQYGIKIGDHLALHSTAWQQRNGSRDWFVDVVGVYRFQDDVLPGNQLWINHEYLDEGRLTDRFTALQLVVRLTDPSSAAVVSQAIDKLFANSPAETFTQSEKDWVRSRINQIGNLEAAINAIITIDFATLLLIISHTVAQGVRERISEFAVLKTLGYGDRLVAAFLIIEAVALCIPAAVLGLIGAAWLFPHFFAVFGIGSSPLPASVFVVGGLLAAAVSLASVLPSALRVHRLSVAAALRQR